MPELPEILHYKHYVESTSLNQVITEAEIKDDYVIPGASEEHFSEHLDGHSFTSVSNHGKYLFLHSTGDRDLMMHFGMTGHPVYFRNEDSEPDYPMAVFHFETGFKLAFDCARKLGDLVLVEDKESYIREKELGPDISSDDFTKETFFELMDSRGGMIKSSLMDQKLMAGIGNECSDEILFQARIHPKKKVRDLTKDELEIIHEKMTEVVRVKLRYLDHGEALPESYILNNRNEGAECPNCGGSIEKITVGGRSGYYCPECQQR